MMKIIIDWTNCNQGFISAVLSILTFFISVAAVVISIIAIKKDTKVSLFEKRHEVYTKFSGLVYGWSAFASDSSKFNYWQMFTGICYSPQCQNPDVQFYLQTYNSHIVMLGQCLFLFKVSPKEILNLRDRYTEFASKLFNSFLKLNLPDRKKEQSLEDSAKVFFDGVIKIVESGIIKKMEEQINVKS